MKHHSSEDIRLGLEFSSGVVVYYWPICPWRYFFFYALCQIVAYLGLYVCLFVCLSV